MQYSIWIIPPEPVYTQLKQTVDQLSRSYNGPIFEPHMTLLGNIDKDLSEIENKVNELATGASTLELSLGPISFSTTYFQSVFVRVNSDADLMQLNLEAKKLFGMNNDVFMPHISLLYGDHDMAIREEAATKVKLSPTPFIINEFVITPAISDPSLWEHSATITFGRDVSN